MHFNLFTGLIGISIYIYITSEYLVSMIVLRTRKFCECRGSNTGEIIPNEFRET